MSNFIINPYIFAGGKAEVTHLGTNGDINQSSYTFTSQSLGAAADDRHIILCVGGFRGATNFAFSSATVAGVSASSVIGTSNSSSQKATLDLLIAAVPTGTTGNIVVTFTNAADTEISWFRATGIGTVVPTGSNVSSDTTTDPSTTVDIPANGFGVAAAYADGGTSVTWTGLTERSDTGTGRILSSASDEFVSAQSSLTVTADFLASHVLPCLVVGGWGP